MIPGANLLSIALSVIGTQTVQHLMTTGRTQNAVGAWVTTYADPVPLQVSWQPVESKKYEQLGLDMAKDYHSIWMRSQAVAISRGESPDRFIYGGRLHEAVDPKDWFSQDGWVEVLVIDIGPYVPPVTP